MVCDLETLTVRWPRPELGHCATEKCMYILAAGYENLDNVYEPVGFRTVQWHLSYRVKIND
jgi:hypothetical protein